MRKSLLKFIKEKKDINKILVGLILVGIVFG